MNRPCVIRAASIAAACLVLFGCVQALDPDTAHAWYRVASVGTDGVPDPDPLGVIGGVARRDDGTYLIGDLGSAMARIVAADGTVRRRLTGAVGGGAPFSSVADVAVGSDGSMYLLDPVACLVHVLDTTGVQVDSFGTCGVGDGQFPANSAYGLGVTDDGAVWVTDTFNGRIVRFDSDPAHTPLPTLGAGGSGPALGEFSLPADVAFSASGDAWVAEAGNNRLQHLDASGAPLDAIDGSTLSPASLGFVRVLVRDDDSFLTAEFDPLDQSAPAGTVRRLGADRTTSRVLQRGNGVDAPGFIDRPFGIAEDPTGAVVVGDQAGQLQRFDSSGDVEVLAASLRPSDASHGRPNGVSVAADGAVGVVDGTDGRLRVFEAGGTLRFVTSPGAFNSPRGVVAASDGTWWVADTYGFPDNRVVQVGPTGVIGAQFGLNAGNGDQQLSAPEAVTMDPSGDYLLVADGNNSRIQVIDVATRMSVDRFGSNGNGDGQYNRPVALAFGPDGMLYVADQYMQRVQRYVRVPGGPGLPPTFTFDAVVINGGYGDERGRFHQINAMAFDPDGRLAVIDQELSRIQWFDRDTGELVDYLSAPGRRAGELFRPVGIGFQADGRAIVADTGNARVQVLKPGTAPADPVIPVDPPVVVTPQAVTPIVAAPTIVAPPTIIVLPPPAPPRDVTIPTGRVASMVAVGGRQSAFQLERSNVAWVRSTRSGALLLRGEVDDTGGGAPIVRVADLDDSGRRSWPAGGAIATVRDGTWQAVVGWRGRARIGGMHTVTYTDAAGNTSTSSFTLKLDDDAPTLIGSASRVARSPYVRFGIEDAGAGATRSAVTVRTPVRAGGVAVRRYVVQDRVGNSRTVVLRVRRAPARS